MPNVTSPREKFQQRCEARAHLWQHGDFGDGLEALHTAVDELEHCRLELKLDADDAQRIMAQAFAKVRES